MIESFISEVKYILKNKSSLFVLLVAPILVNFFLASIFSSGTISAVPMAVYDEDNSIISRMIVQSFRENETFDIISDVSNQYEIENMFNKGKIICGIVIPKDFAKDVKSSKNPSVMMLYDGTNMSMTSAAKAKATEILMTLKVGLNMKIMSAKLNLSKEESERFSQMVSYRNYYLYNPTKNYDYFISPGFGTAMVQTCLALVCASSLRRKEYELVSNKKNVRYLLGKLAFYSICGSIGFILSILINIEYAKIPFRGNLLYAYYISFLLSAAVSSFSIMISSLLDNKSLATTLNAIYFLPSTIIAGYTWPTLSMPLFYQNLSFYLPFYHYSQHIRDLFLKGVSYSQLYSDIQWFWKFILLTFVIACVKILNFKIKKLQRS